MTRRSTDKRFAICLSNRGYRASLVLRKVYEVIADSDAEKRGLLRVIDESGEDYLFPASLFAPIELSEEVYQRLAT